MSERALGTQNAVEAVAWGRAPTHPNRHINRRVICADGFRVSMQASERHYANDSSGDAPYWHIDPEIVWPFITFELGNWSGPRTTFPPPSRGVLTETLEALADENGGVCPWVNRGEVAALLDLHGGAVAWEALDQQASEGGA